MKAAMRRIAISRGSRYFAGLNYVVAGAVLAAHRRVRGVAAIHADGLLIPANYGRPSGSAPRGAKMLRYRRVIPAGVHKTPEVHHA